MTEQPFDLDAPDLTSRRALELRVALAFVKQSKVRS
jgi:hypothetical protein